MLYQQAILAPQDNVSTSNTGKIPKNLYKNSYVKWFIFEIHSTFMQAHTHTHTHAHACIHTQVEKELTGLNVDTAQQIINQYTTVSLCFSVCSLGFALY